ncbi:tagaturonate epimerase family protein [Lentisphaerota bacterium ZTH]|nr:hypothetical protein JYG24_12135 [Lentisphaerota bacterium]WET05762.1 tagaturonate epimerase family protein [Lentisphaerota bacterium ZTH]
MRDIIERASSLINSQEEDIRNEIIRKESMVSFYKKSVCKKDNAIVAMARDERQRFILVISEREDGIISEFEGEQIGDAAIARKCPLSEHNAKVLRKHFPWTAPVALHDRRTTVGCGDRLGLATAGHIAAVAKYEVAPVLAQQSMRELEMTGRTFRNVVDDATFMVFQTGYKNGFGADGNDLKTIPDIDNALAAGISMITLDLSGVTNAAAAEWTQDEIDAEFGKFTASSRRHFEEEYFNKSFKIGDEILEIDAPNARRCAVIYCEALDFAAEVHEYLISRCRDQFDLEISITNTASATLPVQHLFIARELLGRNVEFTSLAPRFAGDFQKAVDFSGDTAQFDRQLKLHAAIAQACGRYKISIHSGSDKFTLYPAIGKMTDMHLHLKTAGTSWLEAVRVIAEKEPVLYRVMHKCALDNYQDMLQLYDVTADIGIIPDVDGMADEELRSLMDMNEARQLLHITYGPILNDKAIRPLFFDAMHKHEECYMDKLRKHFDKHLSLLGVPVIES